MGRLREQGSGEQLGVLRAGEDWGCTGRGRHVRECLSKKHGEQQAGNLEVAWGRSAEVQCAQCFPRGKRRPRDCGEEGAEGKEVTGGPGRVFCTVGGLPRVRREPWWVLGRGGMCPD